MEDWERRVRTVLIDTNRETDTEDEPTSLEELDALIAEGEEIDAALPSYHALSTATAHAKDWLAKVWIFM